MYENIGKITIFGIFFMQIVTIFEGIKLIFSVPEKYMEDIFMNHMWQMRWYLASYWIQVIQFIYTGICLRQIYIESSASDHPHLRILNKISRYMLYSLVLPLSMFLLVAFWSLYLYDRELIYPKALDDFIPSYVNNLMHTYQAPAFLAVMFLNNTRAPPIQHSYIILSILLFIYSITICIVRWKKGLWIYYIFTVIENTHGKFCSSLLVTILLLSPLQFLKFTYQLHYFQNRLHDMMNCQMDRRRSGKTNFD